MKAPSAPRKAGLRARIILRAADGLANAAIAQELGVSRPAVGMWRQRFLDFGLAGLEDAPKPGRPASLPAASVRRVLSEVVQPLKDKARWSCRSIRAGEL